MNRERPRPPEATPQSITPRRLSETVEKVGKKVSGAFQTLSGIGKKDVFLKDPGSPQTERQKARERGEVKDFGKPATAVRTPSGNFVVMGDYVAEVPEGIDPENYAAGFMVGTPKTAEAPPEEVVKPATAPSARTLGHRNVMLNQIIELPKSPPTQSSQTPPRRGRDAMLDKIIVEEVPQAAPAPSAKTQPRHRQNSPPPPPPEAYQ